MEKYSVTGMNCAACSARVEKAVSKVEGVTSCSVNLLTNSMTVEGSVKSEAVIRAVEDAGYGAERLNGTAQKLHQNPKEKSLNKSETSIILKRLIISAVLLIILMYIFSLVYSFVSFIELINEQVSVENKNNRIYFNFTCISILFVLIGLIIFILNLRKSKEDEYLYRKDPNKVMMNKMI